MQVKGADQENTLAITSTSILDIPVPVRYKVHVVPSVLI